MANEAKRRSRNKWNRENMAVKYDRVNILAPKGQKAVIVAAAEQANESISQYILRAVQTRIDNEKEG